MRNLVQSARNLWPSFRYAFRPRKPGLLCRLAKGVVDSKILHRPRLRYVDMALDFACNMRCEHCFATALAPKERSARKMQVADYERVCRQAMSMGALNFSFQGGEPLLVENLPEYIRACRPGLNLISVTTNGSLLNRERIRELKKIGVDIFTISVDSAYPEEHDRFRGFPGAQALAMAAINEAVAQGLHVTIGTTVSHRNVRSEGITRLIEYAETNKLVLVFNLAAPAGKWSQADGILLTEEDLGLVREWVRAYQYVRTDFEANLCQHGCGAVKEILYLTPYGDVLACPFIHISLGNVLEESLADIRRRAVTVPEFAVYADKCLCAQDRDFIEKYILPAGKVGLADGFEVFGWKRPVAGK